jgi:hypothetical protein
VLAFGVLVGGKLVAGERWNPMAVLGVVVTFVGLGLVAGAAYKKRGVHLAYCAAAERFNSAAILTTEPSGRTA